MATTEDTKLAIDMRDKVSGRRRRANRKVPGNP
jgi:hypothetical protein